MDESKLPDARLLIESLYDRGHGKQITIQRMVDVLEVTPTEAEHLFNDCMGAASGMYYEPAGGLPEADCANCKFSDLPHEGAHCYMFVECPGTHCGQFTKK